MRNPNQDLQSIKELVDDDEVTFSRGEYVEAQRKLGDGTPEFKAWLAAQP